MESQSFNLNNCCFCDTDLSPSNQTKSKSITKYRCPGCERFYCKADCFSGHKEKFSCSGVRNKTPYVHISQFDQKQFLDDYFFLEEVNNKIENLAKRVSPRIKSTKNRNINKKKNWKSKRRGPPGNSKVADEIQQK